MKRSVLPFGQEPLKSMIPLSGLKYGKDENLGENGLGGV